MRVAFVYNEVPNREHSTDTHCAFLLLKTLVDAGHDVQAVLLLPEKSIISDSATRKRWLQELGELKINIRILPGDPPPNAHTSLPKTYWFRGQWRLDRLLGHVRNVYRLLNPRLVEYFPHTALAPIVGTPLRSLSPDVMFIWGNWPALAAVYGLQIAPKFAFMGDPPHLPDYYRSRPPFVSKQPGLSFKLWTFNLARMTIRLLAECESVAVTAAHHAEWFRKNGLPHCKHLPNIIPDWGGADWQERRQRQPLNDRFKIMLVGHLQTTANSSGLYLFANDTLPVLERELGNSFEVHIFGKGTVPPELVSKLNRPSVHLRGFVDDIVSELLSSDILLVPTPIKLGIRVRIPYAWSVGCCVIAHQANASGLPEMKHGQNALLAPTGETLALEIVRTFNDKDLRWRLGLEGRRTYESFFSYEVTSRKFLNELANVARKRR